MSRVVLAMSGGVDSSVAAQLLLEQGHDVIGVFMRHGHESPLSCGVAAPNSDLTPNGETASFGAAGAPQLPIVHRLDHKQGCCTAADAEDARCVADRLKIPFYSLNLDRQFDRIIDYFADEYSAGRTPNPCVQCNNWIKFGKLFDYADGVDAEFVATGHYARLVHDGASGPALLRGVDEAKDQSYVLFGVRRELLRRMLLPVGDYQKPKIRQLAAAVGLDVAAKKDSQEICFVTRGRYDELVRSRRGRKGGAPGDFISTEGAVIGRHNGIEGFTVGQRKGLGVALGDPKYVVRIDAQSRQVVLGDRRDLYRAELTAASCNWLVDEAQVPDQAYVQIRYNAPPARAEISLLPEGRLAVRFGDPQFGVAPGQAVVCYDGLRTLGGGWIE